MQLNKNYQQDSYMFLGRRAVGGWKIVCQKEYVSRSTFDTQFRWLTESERLLLKVGGLKVGDWVSRRGD